MQKWVRDQIPAIRARSDQSVDYLICRKRPYSNVFQPRGHVFTKMDGEWTCKYCKQKRDKHGHLVHSS